MLTKSRHSLSIVRYYTVKVVEQCFHRLREQFVVLLPEVMPFIAELMEDDDAEVCLTPFFFVRSFFFLRLLLSSSSSTSSSSAASFDWIDLCLSSCFLSWLCLRHL